MSHTRTLFWVAALMLAAGLGESVGAASDATGLHLLTGLAVSYLCFAWYRGDSDARGFRRSRWLSAGVAAFTPGAIPYYLVRSRREGERVHALMVYAAYLGVVASAVWVGIATQIALGWGW